MERRLDFALANLSKIFERLEEVEEDIRTLEYAISLLSRRIDDIEK